MKTLNKNSTIDDVRAAVDKAFAPDITIKIIKSRCHCDPSVGTNNATRIRKVKERAGISDLASFPVSLFDKFCQAAGHYGWTVESHGWENEPGWND